MRESLPALVSDNSVGVAKKVMANEVVTWGTAIALFVALITATKFWMSISQEITIAKTQASDAKKDADLLNIRLSAMDAAFGLYRERIAEEYINKVAVKQMEDRIMSAINQLGTRVDRVFEQGRT